MTCSRIEQVILRDSMSNARHFRKEGLHYSLPFSFRVSSSVVVADGWYLWPYQDGCR